VTAVVVGAGYTGQRVLDLIPGSLRLSRTELDLDDGDAPAPSLPAEYRMLYTVPPREGVDGDPRLENLVARLDPPPSRFVYISTSGVYGDRGGKRVDESATPTPLTARAKRRVAAETLLSAWCGQRHVDLVILRTPGIYGPGRLGLDRLELGDPVVAEAEAGPGNRIHVDDLAACCVRALDPGTPPGIYNVGDGDYRSATSFAKAVARLAGLEAPPEISRAEAEKVFSATRLSFLRESRVLDTRKMRDVLGFTPRYTNPESGIRASLRAQQPAD